MKRKISAVKSQLANELKGKADVVEDFDIKGLFLPDNKDKPADYSKMPKNNNSKNNKNSNNKSSKSTNNSKKSSGSGGRKLNLKLNLKIKIKIKSGRLRCPKISRK